MRMLFSLAMSLFLLVGCGYNIFYISKINDYNQKHNSRYNPYRQTNDDIEELVEQPTQEINDSIYYSDRQYFN